MAVRLSPLLSRGHSPCRCGHHYPVSFLHGFLALPKHRTSQDPEAFGHCRLHCWPGGKTRESCGDGDSRRSEWPEGAGSHGAPLLAAPCTLPEPSSPWKVLVFHAFLLDFILCLKLITRYDVFKYLL